MLYKFSVKDYFADCPDRCGVIQAEDIYKAVRRFIHWTEGNSDWGDYEADTPKIEIKPEQDLATITYNVKQLTDDVKGIDSYIIRSVGDDILSFLAQDWNLTFD